MKTSEFGLVSLIYRLSVFCEQYKVIFLDSKNFCIHSKMNDTIVYYIHSCIYLNDI